MRSGSTFVGTATHTGRVMTDRQQPGIVWFRRDLRLDDNPAWAAATAAHDEVVALFVLEPALLDSAGSFRRDQLLAHLQSLDARLQTLGGCLVVREGPAAVAVPQLVSECDGSTVYFNADSTPFATRRDEEVVAAVGDTVRIFHGLTVHEPGSVLTQKGTLSQVFTPFFKRWTAVPLSPWPEAGTGRPVAMQGVPLPSPEGAPRQDPGEDAAWQRLTNWLDRVDDYPNTRDIPAIDGTSDLSADLKFGTISARSICDVVGRSTQGRAAFVRQLAWRDWWAHTLTVRQDLPDVALKGKYDNIVWRNDPDEFWRWCVGSTGYPIVDAGMRQLSQTGWMHNRVRMICASFLVKDLLVDWRRGERFFRHHLVDADVAQNAGNWQWVAGTGPDASPYFRIFNPTSQGQKFDPSGEYVRQWVPELAGLAGAAIHEPEASTPAALAAAGVVLGETYPEPVVAHKEARLRALDVYKRAVS